MTIFQVIGITSLLFILAAYFRKFRTPAIDKVLITIILLMGIYFILYPEKSNQIAKVLGIGRGADLIFYLAILGFSYLVLVLYSKINRLEEQMTTIIRKQALESANLSETKL